VNNEKSKDKDELFYVVIVRPVITLGKGNPKLPALLIEDKFLSTFLM
jgi:hypothetical protein